MGKSHVAILEENRMSEIHANMAAQRAARLAAGPVAKSPRVKRHVPDATSWEADVRNYILHIVRPTSTFFTLSMLYDYIADLSDLHPNNLVDPAAQVRHQLQELRDKGEVEFITPGYYRYIYPVVN